MTPAEAKRIVDLLDPNDRAPFARALATYVFRVGDAAPPSFPTMIAAANARQRRPSTVTTVAVGEHTQHCLLMTHTETAAATGLSKRTIGRRVADKRLTGVGNLISAASVDEFCASRSNLTSSRAGRT